MHALHFYSTACMDQVFSGSLMGVCVIRQHRLFVGMSQYESCMWLLYVNLPLSIINNNYYMGVIGTCMTRIDSYLCILHQSEHNV